MGSYYAENLSAHRLKRVYDLAPPRVRQYLDAEAGFKALTGDLGLTSRIIEVDSSSVFCEIAVPAEPPTAHRTGGIRND